MLRIDFQGNDAPVLAHRAAKPNRAVTTERADFEHAACAGGLREQKQELALYGRDRDRRQSRRGTGCERALECGGITDKQFG